jgi:hypothetical protein
MRAIITTASSGDTGGRSKVQKSVREYQRQYLEADQTKLELFSTSELVLGLLSDVSNLFSAADTGVSLILQCLMNGFDPASREIKKEIQVDGMGGSLSCRTALGLGSF